ncbi:YwgA family protein [Ammoniphilus sp. CFH 90114]|uniref:YwgA family protein n=1 Tax=Ammoniphilus sp. CFH 90114 TaxID=2493665 RepID=UPI00100E590E|nr:YwgA family protein [Ammoniphilus sp. CFH 90114]RXT08726.1 YwgA family protein [Ammoniphilus sp. CFH 90114]
MLQEHAKVLFLLEQAGEVVGRKKLQKMVYITQRLDYDFNQRFHFHFYGPYSEELSLEVEELCQLGFLDEVLEDKGNYNVYRYSITDKGKDFLQHVKTDVGNLSPVLDKMNESSARFLELVSTVLYFEKLTREEVEEKILTLKAKSNYSTEEITDAYSWIEGLRAARLTL